MSVPLDRLYNYVDGLCNHDILIYRFFRHGSKKLEGDVKDCNISDYCKQTDTKIISDWLAARGVVAPLPHQD